LPFINDTRENIDGIIDYCVRAGVKAIICFGIGLTLREGNREYFYKALDRIWGGPSLRQAQDKLGSGTAGSTTTSLKELYQKTFGYSYMCSSPQERQLMNYLSQQCRRYNIMLGTDSVFKWLEEFPKPEPVQPGLFDDMN
jgi:hypothetical protein